MTDHVERIRLLRSKFEELEGVVRASLYPPAAPPVAEPSVHQPRIPEQGLRAFLNRLFGGKE